MPLRVYTTAPLEDPRTARTAFPTFERIGYDGAFSFEAKHDPFLPLATAAEHTQTLQLGTAIAIAFARNPMVLASLGHGLQSLSGGRFLLGLGSQVRPHIEKRFSSTWSRPAARMREIVQAIRAIWECWETGTPLDFRGEFYTHTLMIPAFNPGPHPFGAPPIHVAAFGPGMTRVAGEVGDGFIAHPFTTRRSLLEVTLPALEKGLAAAGRTREQLDVLCATMIVTADEERWPTVVDAARAHLAFYGSTPAYLPTLACHGWDALHGELNRLSKQGRWQEMAGLIDDDVLETIAVVGPPGTPAAELAAKLRARVAGIADGISLTHNRAPDPEHWAGVVSALKEPAGTGAG